MVVNKNNCDKPPHHRLMEQIFWCLSCLPQLAASNKDSIVAVTSTIVLTMRRRKKNTKNKLVYYNTFSL